MVQQAEIGGEIKIEFTESVALQAWLGYRRLCTSPLQATTPYCWRLTTTWGARSAPVTLD